MAHVRAFLSANHRGRLHGRANREHARPPAAGDEHGERSVEQIVDIPASQIQEQLVEDVKIIPQALVLFRTKSRSWTCRFPEQGHAAGVRFRAHFRATRRNTSITDSRLSCGNHAGGATVVEGMELPGSKCQWRLIF